MKQPKVPVILLSAGLALVFGLFGLGKFLDPLTWIGWIPLWMEGFLGLPANGWLRLFGLLEMTIAVMLITQQRKIQRVAALIASIQLVGVLTQTGWNDVAVRDTAILASALALFFLLRKE